MMFISKANGNEEFNLLCAWDDYIYIYIQVECPIKICVITIYLLLFQFFRVVI